MRFRLATHSSALALLLASPLAAQAFDSTLFNGMRWRSIGPNRGGRSIAATGIPSRRNEYCFGAVGGGLWKTTDGGVSWRPVTDGQIRSSSVGAVVVSESNPDILYIWMGETEFRGNIMQGDGVYRSGDGGKTWKKAGLEKVQAIARLRVDRTNPDLVYAAAFGKPYAPSAERGVYRTRDGGKTWERVLFRNDSTAAVDLVIDPVNPNVLYAALWQAYRTPWTMSSGGAGSGLFKSTDGGDSWTELTRNPGMPKGTIGKIGVAPSGPRPGRTRARGGNHAVGGPAAGGRGVRGERLGRRFPLRRRRRPLEAHHRRPQAPPARLLLLPDLRRSEGQGRGVRAQHQYVPLHRRRRHLQQRPRPPRRQP